MSFYKITEQESNHKNLEKKSVSELVKAMHEEDNNALNAVNKVLPDVTNLIENIAPKISGETSSRAFFGSFAASSCLDITLDLL